MRLRGFPAVCLFAGLLAGPVAAGGHPFELIPPEPTSADEIKVRMTFENVNPGFRPGPVWLKGPSSVNVTFDGSFFCEVHCVDETVEVSLGRLDEDHYHLSVWHWIDDHLEPFYIGSFHVAAAAAPALGYSPIQLEPMAPTDADRVRLTLPYLLAACEQDPSLQRLERRGQDFAITVLRPPVPATCSPALPARLFALPVDLGQLAAGAHRVDLAEQSVAGGAATAVASRAFPVAPAEGAVVLLGRYRVSASWRTPDGAEGRAQPLAGRTDESVLYTFFGPDNWELLVKVLDGCTINGHRWVFLAAATTVEFTLTVVDLEAPEHPYVHFSAGGSPAPPLTDIAAFACDP